MDAKERTEVLKAALAGFPDTVLPVVYPQLEPPLRLPLARLVTLEQVRGQQPIEDRVLAKFVRRLREVRGELSEAELLELRVPASAGDQQAFLARLGKWRFELKQLERALDTPTLA